MDDKKYPGSEYQNLFDFMQHEHGTILTQSNMDELIHIVHKFHPHGAAWVKATTRTATHGKQVFAKDGSGRKTVGYFTKSNPTSDVIDCFYSMVGSFHIKGKDYESLEWYDDESGQSKEGNKDREVERRNKLLEDNMKLGMRLNMPGISEQEQEATWQDYKRRNDL